MEGMTLAEAAAAMQGEQVGTGEAVPTGACIDSRHLEAGQIFFALPGERVDGHRFIGAAFERGASAAVVSRAWYKTQTSDAPGPLVVVDAPDLALGDLARTYRKRFKIPVVGITGSNGKTTTKEMAAAVLATRYRVLATEGNLNNRLGVPLTVLRLSAEHEVAVLEMGISEHNGLRYLCEISDPNIGVITNIGPTHLEFLGSVEGVAKAKGELLEYLGESSMAILNLDDLLLSKERARLKGRLLDFGIEKICQFRGEGLVLNQEGCGHFSLQGFCFQLRIPGRHNVYNALAAAAVGVALDVPISEAARALASFRPPRLRSQVLEHNGIRILNDTYNANPASMRAALEAVVQMEPAEGGRRIAVLGDMLEMGSGAADAHRALGEFAAIKGVRALFALGTLAEEVAQGGMEGGLPAERSRAFADQEVLVADLAAFLKPGDLVLLKGSRGLAMEAVATALGFELN
ncbi:MAG: UDP-N-acetylmuramoyl-tripeptide--D-alanyl-D-alanine ligase [bacterium]|nr:UDP-N-acetylmuramoyl-tripeptide--D-alanyl-D-alanine ligase [bacterium]